MYCKNKYLNVCSGRVLQGHDLGLTLPPFLLPPALPSFLCSDGCPGEEEIRGALWPLFQLSFSPQRAHNQSLHNVKPRLSWSLHFLQASSSHWTQMSPVSSLILTCTKTAPDTGFFTRLSSSRKTTMTRAK